LVMVLVPSLKHSNQALSPTQDPHKPSVLRCKIECKKVLH